MEDMPSIPSALNAELVSMSLGEWSGEEGLTIRIRLENSTEFEVEVPRDSPDLAEVLDVLSRLATKALSPIGQSGLQLTGLAPVEEWDEEDDGR